MKGFSKSPGGIEVPILVLQNRIRVSGKERDREAERKLRSKTEKEILPGKDQETPDLLTGAQI